MTKKHAFNFIFDWDGTLGGTNGHITSKSIDALKAIYDMIEGVIIIATARHPFEIFKQLEKLNLVKYIVGGNGGIVFDVDRKKIIKISNIPNFYSREIIEYIKKNNWIITYMNSKGTYTSHFAKNKSLTLYTIPNKYPINYVTNEDVERLRRNVVFIETRILNANVLDKQINFLRSRYKKKLSITMSDQYYINITNKNIDKWNSIKWLLNKIKNKNKNIAFGDSMNDIEMIKNSDIGIAMGNGDSFLKEEATMIIEDSNNDGIKKFIDSIKKNENLLHKIIEDK